MVERVRISGDFGFDPVNIKFDLFRLLHRSIHYEMVRHNCVIEFSSGRIIHITLGLFNRFILDFGVRKLNLGFAFSWPVPVYSFRAATF
ncbi:MAG: hypothetical protein JST85_08005 [Acidobacteria bacterium]|nr:hypothetical protein [Acidobacteriota bacterium]